jgi:indolepyruvate ferredoxin oxidoreductase beta subunit
MSNSGTFGLVVAGVGGQGAITIAQLVLGAAWMSDLHVLQSEVHGMSQRGGEVSAHILFSKEEVTSPTIEAGTGDLLLGLEPLETLRHLLYLKKDAPIISSSSPVVNMDSYPKIEEITKLLENVDGIKLFDSDAISKELHFSQGGNIALLGASSNYLPIDDEIWEKVISERFQTKGTDVIEKNMNAFYMGKDLIKQ